MSGGGGGTPEPTEQERALTETNAKEWNDYVRRFIPLENEMVDQIRATDGERAAAAGSANADAAMAFDGMDQRTIAQGLSAGADVGSGRTLTQLGKNVTAQGGASGLGQAQAVQGVDDNELVGLEKMTRFGRGLGDQAQLSMRSGARRATQTALHEARIRQQEQDATMEAVGTVAGMGLRRYGPGLVQTASNELDLLKAGRMGRPYMGGRAGSLGGPKF